MIRVTDPDAGICRFFVAFYLASGVTLPFFAPYLRGLGLPGHDISMILSVGPLMQLGVPMFWAWQADRSGRALTVLRWLCIGALLFITPLIAIRTMPGLLISYALHQFFLVGIATLADALALRRIALSGKSYSEIRLLGSFSFAVTSVGAGLILSQREKSGGDAMVPLLMTLGFALTLLTAITIRGEDNDVRTETAHGPPKHRSRQRRTAARPHLSSLLLLLTTAFLHWVANAPSRGFFAIMVRDRGFSEATLGQLFLIAVLAEIVAFRIFDRLCRHFALRWLLAASFAAAALRLLATATAQGPLTLGLLQLLHAFSFGINWSASLEWLKRCTPSPSRSIYQGLYMGVTFGLGAMLGTLGTGFLLDKYNDVSPAFVVGGVIEFLPFCIILVLGRRLEPGPLGDNRKDAPRESDGTVGRVCAPRTATGHPVRREVCPRHVAR